jgi:hypothetical protein
MVFVQKVQEPTALMSEDKMDMAAQAETVNSSLLHLIVLVRPQWTG